MRAPVQNAAHGLGGRYVIYGNRWFFGIFMTLCLVAFSAVGAFAQTPNPCPKNSPFTWPTSRDPRCWPFSQSSPFNTSLKVNAQGLQPGIVPIAPSNTVWKTYTLGFSYQANTSSIIFASDTDPTWELWNNLYYQYPPQGCDLQCILNGGYEYNNSVWYEINAPSTGDSYPQTWCQPITSADFSSFMGYSNYPPVQGQSNPYNFNYNPWSISNMGVLSSANGGYNPISSNYNPTFHMPKNYCGSPDSDGLTSVMQPEYLSHLAVDLYAPIVSPGNSAANGNNTNYVFAKELGNYIDLEGSGTADTTSGTGFVNGRRASLIAPFAGLIRYPELSNGFIPHALAATIGADMLACQPTSPEAYNFTGQAFPQAWPAFGYDQQNIAGGALCAASGGLYKNAYGNIPMGSLLAIPKSLTLSPSLFQTCTGPNDTTCQVYVVAVALQDYGAYVVDTGSNTYMTLMAELNDADVVQQNPTYLANDFAYILHNLELVTNNSQTSVGGVGTSIITNLAPPFTY